MTDNQRDIDIEAAMRWFGDRIPRVMIEMYADFRAEARSETEERCQETVVQVLRNIKSTVDAALMARDDRYRLEQARRPHEDAGYVPQALPAETKTAVARRQVLDVLRTRGPMNRHDLSLATNISPDTISPTLTRLKSVGEVVHDEVKGEWSCALPIT